MSGGQSQAGPASGGTAPDETAADVDGPAPAEPGTDGPGRGPGAGGGAQDPAGTRTGPQSADPAELTRLIRAAVHDELNWLPDHVLNQVRRDRAFDALNDRLRSAERRLETRRERPLIVAVHRMLNRLRRLDFDQAVKDSLEAELVKILASAGMTETGQVGEEYDADRHEALEGTTADDGTATVAEVLAPGLGAFDEVVIRSLVRIAPADRQA
jgi:hypothetical protein